MMAPVSCVLFYNVLKMAILVRMHGNCFWFRIGDYVVSVALVAEEAPLFIHITLLNCFVLGLPSATDSTSIALR